MRRTIEQLQEENRYLKVVYTERISHLVAENGVLRNQLLEAEQELLDDAPVPRFHDARKPPAVTISVDLHGLDDGLSGPRPISPALDESLGSLVSSPIGFSPLGAGRLMYSQFR